MIDCTLYNNVRGYYLAVEPTVPVWACAFVCSVAVLAGGAVHAGFRITFVDIMLAVVTGEPGRAEAGKRVDAVHTGATIEARAVTDKSQ